MTNERATVAELTQLAPEVTAGSAVAATRRLEALQIQPEIKTKTTPFKPQGWKYNAALSVDQEWTEAKLSGIGDYASMIYPLAGLFGAVTPITPVGGTNTRDWIWNPSTTVLDTPQTFTIEAGSSVRAGKFAYGLVNEFGVTYTRMDVKVDGAMFGQKYQDGITLTTPPSEVQTLSITGTPTGGTFTLTYNGQTTSPIAYSAIASAVQTALQALSTIGSGNVTCSGGPLPGSSVTITFAGSLAGMTHPLITANSASLTGGSSPTAAVVETTPGGMDVVANPIFPTHNTLYLDTTSAANLGITALTRGFEFSWKISNKWGQVWPINASNPSFAASVETEPKVELKLLLEADAVGMGYLTQFRAGSTMWLRMQSVGATAIEGSLYPTHNADFAAKITDINPFKDQNGVWAIEYTLENFHDAVWGQSMAFLCRNKLTAL